MFLRKREHKIRQGIPVCKFCSGYHQYLGIISLGALSHSSCVVLRMRKRALNNPNLRRYLCTPPVASLWDMMPIQFLRENDAGSTIERGPYAVERDESSNGRRCHGDVVTGNASKGTNISIITPCTSTSREVNVLNAQTGTDRTPISSEVYTERYPQYVRSLKSSRREIVDCQSSIAK